MHLTRDKKSDAALKDAFPARDAFRLKPQEASPEPCKQATAPSS